MISFKKSYAEQLLQLALALSLMRVDPENYLGWGYESQLALQNGDGWQLELRAAPLTDYPYANRKALMPIIEDLARFREMNSYDVTAYLLNVQSAGETRSQSPTTTATNQETDTPIPLQQAEHNSTEYVTLNRDLDDNFLNSEFFSESESILDQNLADLSDYGDMPFTTFPFLAMPLKDEPPDIIPESLFSEIRRERASTSFSSGIGSIDSPPPSHHHTTNFSGPPSPHTTTSTVIDWNDYFDIKPEIKEELIEEEDVFEETNSTTTSQLGSQELTKEVRRIDLNFTF